MDAADVHVWSRRTVLKAGAAATLAVGSTGFGLGHASAKSGGKPTASSNPAAPASGTPAPAGQVFGTRPDLHPPRFEVLTAGPTGPDAGLLLTTPAKGQAQSGPMIIDGAGQLVWFRPMPGARLATNLQVQSYQGRPVLTWWEGVINEDGWGKGEMVIADTSYRDVARIEVGDGLVPDLHDGMLTSAGTGLVVVYHPISADLRAVGGAAAGQLLDCGVQEVDVASGAVVFEWMGSHHVDVTETYAPNQTAEDTAPFDFLHANSVAEDLDGNLLLSARHTSAIYKIDRTTGAVLWRLGGRRSDFAVAEPATFAWQHDAKRLADGRLSLFDNGAGLSETQPQSRGLLLDVDETARTASLGTAYSHPSSLSATSQGSTEVLADGEVVVGWGSTPYISQFAPDGAVHFDGRFLDAAASYRAFRSPWSTSPGSPPALAVVATAPSLQVQASWNGATEVATWKLLAGATGDGLAEIARVPRAGFETTITTAATNDRLTAVEALDAAGAPLGRSAPVRL